MFVFSQMSPRNGTIGLRRCLGVSFQVPSAATTPCMIASSRCVSQCPMAVMGFNMSSSCMKKYITTLVLLILGMMFGVLINRYGLFMEPIVVDIRVNVDDIPAGFRNQSKPAIAERLRRNLLNHTEYVVPNIVHFIWFGKNRPMTFLHYISISSARKMQRPDTIMLHCDHLPLGPWWHRLRKETHLKIVHREPPETIHNQTLMHMYHKGDVAKMEILQEFGGIYLDYDVIVLHSMNPLRHFDITMGKEKVHKLNAGIILARKDALFLKIFYESYRNNYRALDWDYNCARVAYQLSLSRPDLLHIEKYRLTTPDWTERHLLWQKTIDWSDLYVVHVMLHLSWYTATPESIKTMPGTFGEIMRYIYYGSPKPITDS